MDPKFAIIFRRYEQPDESVWEEIRDFVEQWNQTKQIRFITGVPAELATYFSDDTNNEIKELERLLAQKNKEKDWKWKKLTINDPTADIIEQYDFIQIIGDGYPDKFFLNEEEALSPVYPCITCGTTHQHLVTQLKPLQVNEAYLDKKKTEPNSRYTPAGLDMVNMPHGALLVTKKVIDLIGKVNRIQGYNFFEVIDKDGKVSERLFQLASNHIILQPDNLSDKKAICGTCGAVLDNLPNPFAIKKKRLEGSSFFSRNPSGVSSLYISKQLYQILKTENVRGLTPVQGVNLIDD